MSSLLNSPIGTAVLSLLFAFLGGLTIGVERSLRGRQAGLRTYALIALASAAPVVVLTGFTDGHPSDALSRVIQGVLAGVGFLGAGLIIRDGVSVKGLTTAAAVWLTAALGVVAGTGQWALGSFIVGLALITLTLLRVVEQAIDRDYYAVLHIRLQKSRQLTEEGLLCLLREFNIRPLESAYAQTKKGAIDLDITVSFKDGHTPARLVRALQDHPDVELFSLGATKVDT